MYKYSIESMKQYAAKIYTSQEVSTLISKISSLDASKLDKILSIPTDASTCFSPAQLMADIKFREEIYKDFKGIIKTSLIAMSKCNPDDIKNNSGKYLELKNKLLDIYGEKNAIKDEKLLQLVNCWYVPKKFESTIVSMYPDHGRKDLNAYGWTKSNLNTLSKYYDFMCNTCIKYGEEINNFCNSNSQWIQKNFGSDVAYVLDTRSLICDYRVYDGYNTKQTCMTYDINPLLRKIDKIISE